MIIAVDFDGTCVTHEYPKVGRNINAAPVLRKILDKGHNIILWTMRSGTTLEEAVAWFTENGIFLFGINENPEQKEWTNSPKAYAQMYIDDAALGCPLTYASSFSNRPYVDWNAIEQLLIKKGII